ncbi:MAG: glutamate--tRNA ligase [bacterium]|nr:glutamate--tRNA ligase [bacterium]
MPTSETLQKTAQLLYPHVTKTLAELELQYPPRQLPPGAYVTRVAPSPTGFMHIGGIFASLVSRTLAHQTKGIFFLRIEDTDQKREVEGGAAQIINTMNHFLVSPDEGVVAAGEERGEYGPYVQSHRQEIYSTYAKWMVENDFAYPCFCTAEELKEISIEQVRRKVTKGCYGEWAVSRQLTHEQIADKLAQGMTFVLRVKAPEARTTVKVRDEIRGSIEFKSNEFDMVLIKSDGIPTYHFAHVVDDHLMRTTHVTRGEEWLATLPLHAQLFEMLGFPLPVYLHFSHIGKKEGGSTRKLSKRKDPEAAMSFYAETGYPAESINEYLLSLASPRFLEWHKDNPEVPYSDFTFEPKELGKSIVLFDKPKLDFISKNIISRLSADEVYRAFSEWAQQFDPEFYEVLQADQAYATNVMNIEREQEQPRKDFATWSEFKEGTRYFFDSLLPNGLEYAAIPEKVTPADAVAFLELVAAEYTDEATKDVWMSSMRSLAAKVQFAPDGESFKAAPESYKGQLKHVMAVLRIAITGKKDSPDLYQVMQVMGDQRVASRVAAAIAYFKKA